MCGHLLGQMLDLKVKVRVNGEVDLLGHKVGHVDLKWPLDLLGHTLGQTDHKGHRDL